MMYLDNGDPNKPSFRIHIPDPSAFSDVQTAFVNYLHSIYPNANNIEVVFQNFTCGDDEELDSFEFGILIFETGAKVKYRWDVIDIHYDDDIVE